MSYEGYNQYILKDGSYHEVDVYLDDVDRSQVEWFHSVDVTNGTDENNLDTCFLEVDVTATVEVEETDYKGNKYYILKPIKYAPSNPSLWRKLT